MKAAGARRALAFAVAALFALVALFCVVYRPWQVHWGATDEEIARRMAGDRIVEDPTFNATRAVTVDAPPEAIWPWIVQIGYRRAGFYSWDILDNGGIASAERIVPEYQGLEVGDVVPLSAHSNAIVTEMDPPRHLLLVFRSGTPATWAWGLYPIDSGHTRLVTRLRVRTDRPTTKLMLRTFEIVMMRKHLLGIKHRAERLAQEP